MLKMRTFLFHRIYTDKRISITSLRRLYIKNKVKRKQVRKEKSLPPHIEADFQPRCNNLLTQITVNKRAGFKIIYLDEILFSKSSIRLRDWSAKNSNLSIN